MIVLLIFGFLLRKEEYMPITGKEEVLMGQFTNMTIFLTHEQKNSKLILNTFISK